VRGTRKKFNAPRRALERRADSWRDVHLTELSLRYAVRRGDRTTIPSPLANSTSPAQNSGSDDDPVLGSWGGVTGCVVLVVSGIVVVVDDVLPTPVTGVVVLFVGGTVVDGAVEVVSGIVVVDTAGELDVVSGTVVEVVVSGTVEVVVAGTVVDVVTSGPVVVVSGVDVVVEGIVVVEHSHTRVVVDSGTEVVVLGALDVVVQSHA